MNIGITGATGQLGRLVVSQLKEKGTGHTIVALVRSPEKASDLGVETREADYTKPETLVSSFQGIDKLLFISSSEVGQRDTQHSNVIEAAKQAGVKHIVYTSLVNADTSALSLAKEHLFTEAALKKAGIPYTVLRNGGYAEIYASTIGGALAGGAFIGSAGEGKISAATRADYAEAAVVVLTSEGHEGKIYELAGDEAFTMPELAAEVSRQTGKDIPYKNMPEEEYAKALIGFGLPEDLAHVYAGLDTAVTTGSMFNDSHELSGLIGRPTTPLSEVVAQALKEA